ncbi:hypothetical protein OWV82_002223 [Melia azedarach]|uniref:Uncharacterized protein n=1 Tax=Melia azedarach TaxID=155640 RepID=A0ACC1Z2C0_MELAZ|nr:hypothetical protein OWV82_002223 [Melia azedarach]
MADTPTDDNQVARSFSIVTMAETPTDDNHVAISIESLASSLENMMDDNSITMSSNCCIFRTPIVLYRHNKKAFVPNGFSIGPYHYGEERLQPAQIIKLKYLQGLLSRSTNPKEKLRELIEDITSVEELARQCYSGSIGFAKEEFVKILVLDGCFIIELLRKNVNEVSRDEDDPLFSMACLNELINHDLILLENQIPWFVLDRLFMLTMIENPGNKGLIELVLRFYNGLFSSDRVSINADQYRSHKIRHILDLLRYSLILPIRSEKYTEKNPGWEPFSCAAKINEAGIEFNKKKNYSTILDIKFSNGTLDIPPLAIHETTEAIFRNLISFEQCCPNCEPFVTSYAKFMDNLIYTTKDVELLTEKGILNNWLDPDDATLYFNKLYNDTYVKKFYYDDICKQVNAYCRSWWNRTRYFYMHNYFGTPWAIVSQIAAAFLLLFTFLQTYYTIMGVVRQPSRSSS